MSSLPPRRWPWSLPAPKSAALRDAEEKRLARGQTQPVNLRPGSGIQQTSTFAPTPGSGGSGGTGGGTGGAPTGGTYVTVSDMSVSLPSSRQLDAGTGLTQTDNGPGGTIEHALTVPVDETLGGTGQTTITQGDLLYGSAANTISKLAKDANATRYLSNQGSSNNPSWNQVNLANGVTGTLPTGNGGSKWTDSAGSLSPTTAERGILIDSDGSGGNSAAIEGTGDGIPAALLSADLPLSAAVTISNIDTTGANAGLFAGTSSSDNGAYGLTTDQARLDNYADLVEQGAAPATPPGSRIRFYGLNDSQLYMKNDAGGIEPVSAGATDLDDLKDVNAPSPADGDALTWDNGAGEWVNTTLVIPTNTWAQSLYVGEENNTCAWNYDIQERVTGQTIPTLTYTSEPSTFTFDKTTTPASATTGELYGRFRWTSQDLATDVQGQVGIAQVVRNAGDSLTIYFRVRVSLTARLEAVWARISDGTNTATSTNQIGSMSNATWHEFSITQDTSAWGSEIRIMVTAQGTRTGANMGLTLFDMMWAHLEWA